LTSGTRADPDDWDWSDFEFADTHTHIWNLDDPRLHYSYLEPGFVHPQLGDISALRRNYSADDLIRDFGRVDVRWAVHVQAAFGIADPYNETAFVQESIDETGFPTVMVANVDLRADDVGDQLVRHLTHDRVRGIRDQKSDPGYLDDPSYRRGARQLIDVGLHLEIEHWGDLSSVADLAGSLPDLPVVLDHAGRPSDLTNETHQLWRKRISRVASHPNTWCKISGLGMAKPSWGTEDLRPFVETCIEVFGVDRCFFGTNWPVDSMYSSYEVLLASYRSLLGGASPDERNMLFVGNAERLYRLEDARVGDETTEG
jgi:predicted TIM-barrel fold metal-dependent hydrolase